MIDRTVNCIGREGSFAEYHMAQLEEGGEGSGDGDCEGDCTENESEDDCGGECARRHPNCQR